MASLNFNIEELMQDTALYALYLRLYNGLNQSKETTPPDCVNNPPKIYIKDIHGNIVLDINGNPTVAKDEDGVDLIDEEQIAEVMSEYAEIMLKNTAYMMASAIIPSTQSCFVSSDIEGNVFSTYASLLAGPYFVMGQSYWPSNNDYAFVRSDENHNGVLAFYSYRESSISEQSGVWVFQYSISSISGDIDFSTFATKSELNSKAHAVKFGNVSYNLDNIYQSNSEGVVILPGLIWSNITGLQGKLDEKANVSHTHNQSDIEGLNNALSAKVDKDGNKVLSDNNFSNEDKAQITTNKGDIGTLQGYFDAQGHAKKANSLDTHQVGSNKLPVYFTNSGVPEVIDSLEVQGNIASTHGGLSALGISDLSVSQDGSSSNFDVSIIAEPFSSAQNYKKGDLCTFADRLWRFKTSYSGAWDQSKVELSNVGEEVMGLKEVNDAQDDILSELAHALNYMELWH